jgi:hypothetical protein
MFVGEGKAEMAPCTGEGKRPSTSSRERLLSFSIVRWIGLKPGRKEECVNVSVAREGAVIGCNKNDKSVKRERKRIGRERKPLASISWTSFCISS